MTVRNDTRGHPNHNNCMIQLTTFTARTSDELKILLGHLQILLLLEMTHRYGNIINVSMPSTLAWDDFRASLNQSKMCLIMYI